ncbi:MAG TPA: hypothetical protein VFB62_04605, partial [Polyangiaceae bacterium]|nr:hypothetical protein [Polyangiaceae bacterium]
MKSVSAAMAAFIVVGCTIDRSGEAEVGAATSGAGGGAVGPGTTAASATTGTGSGGGRGGCYNEAYHLDASLSDLQSSYQGAQWLGAMLETLGRRYDNGWYVVDAMKTDPWLTDSFPSFFELGSFAGMIESLDTACHEETHGYDFEQALSFPDEHL